MSLLVPTPQAFCPYPNTFVHVKLVLLCGQRQCRVFKAHLAQVTMSSLWTRICIHLGFLLPLWSLLNLLCKFLLQLISKWYHLQGLSLLLLLVYSPVDVFKYSHYFMYYPYFDGPKFTSIIHTTPLSFSFHIQLASRNVLCRCLASILSLMKPVIVFSTLRKEPTQKLKQEN